MRAAFFRACAYLGLGDLLKDPECGDTLADEVEIGLSRGPSFRNLYHRFRAAMDLLAPDIAVPLRPNFPSPVGSRVRFLRVPAYRRTIPLWVSDYRTAVKKGAGR